MVDDVTREEIREGKENRPKPGGGSRKSFFGRWGLLVIVAIAVVEAALLVWITGVGRGGASSKGGAAYDPRPWLERVADRATWTFSEISVWCEPPASKGVRERDRRFSAEFVVYVDRRFQETLAGRGEEFLQAAQRTARMAIKEEMARLGPELKKPSMRTRFEKDLKDVLNKIEPFRGEVVLGVEMDKFQASRY